MAIMQIIQYSHNTASYRKTSNRSPGASVRTSDLEFPACIRDPACIETSSTCHVNLYSVGYAVCVISNALQKTCKFHFVETVYVTGETARMPNGRNAECLDGQCSEYRYHGSRPKASIFGSLKKLRYTKLK